jgi:hypothetical protein
MVIINKHPVYHNQNGFAIVTVVFVLAFITLAGVMMIQTTNNELQISTNDQIYKISFYAAEAAKTYVMLNSDLYGSENIEAGTPASFPDTAQPAVTQLVATNSSQSFNGTVEYQSSAEPPRGSGFQSGKYRAHRYQMLCNGWGPRDSKIVIDAGFYRIGF